MSQSFLPRITIHNRLLFILLTLVLLILFFLAGRSFPAEYYTDHQLHSFWLNVCLVNLTFMGDGWFALALVAWMAYKRIAGWKSMLMVWMLVTGLVQCIQNLWSGTEWTIYVEQGQYLFFTDKQEHLSDPGMISGHTAVAVAMGLCLSAMRASSGYTWLFAVMASGVAVSRLFLSGQGPGAIWGGVFAGIAAYILAQFSISLVSHLLGMMSTGWKFRSRRDGTLGHPYPGV